jgi:glutamyl-Q tRNA(Asp) synthetase
MAAAAVVGRFAPSPTGPLHAGSLVAALASWLDARAHGGRWLLRIEDIDRPRCVPGADRLILQQLARCGLLPDEPPLWQSSRDAAYAAALQQLLDAGAAYPCGCTRKEIEGALAACGAGRARHEELVYPGTCRSGLHGKLARAWRLRVVHGGDSFGVGNHDHDHDHDSKTSSDSDSIHGGDIDSSRSHGSETAVIDWSDRRLGPQRQHVAHEVGDFVLRRADGLWAYQLAVVVDDAAQGVTHVVRGEDLADNTARQMTLQHALGLPTPAYLHTPLVLAADGQKLSKQNGAVVVDLAEPLTALAAAASVLGLPTLHATTPGDWLALATRAWAARWVRPAPPVA